MTGAREWVGLRPPKPVASLSPIIYTENFGKKKNFGSMTVAHSLTPNLVYIQNMATSIPTHSHKTILCTYICSIYKFKVFSLHNIINYNTCTMSGQILLCSSVPHDCTWKIVFNIQNNELNELSECMLYKIF